MFEAHSRDLSGRRKGRDVAPLFAASIYSLQLEPEAALPPMPTPVLIEDTDSANGPLNLRHSQAVISFCICVRSCFKSVSSTFNQGQGLRHEALVTDLRLIATRTSRNGAADPPSEGVGSSCCSTSAAPSLRRHRR